MKRLNIYIMTTHSGVEEAVVIAESPDKAVDLIRGVSDCVWLVQQRIGIAGKSAVAQIVMHKVYANNLA